MKMKAVYATSFQGPSSLELRDNEPKPEVDADKVLVKVHCAGVNHIDKAVLYGKFGHFKVTPPFIPGIDAAGVIEAVGNDVTKFKEGDRVYTYARKLGCFAEYVSANQDNTHHLPTHVSFQQGAVVPIPYMTAYRALVQRGQVKSGETVLIHGASGSVGLACCQIARSLGLTVIGTAGTTEGSKLVKEHGAEHVFNHREQEHIRQVLDVTSGKGVDIIVETTMSLNFEGDIEMTSQGGRIMVIGRGPGQLQASAEGLLKKELSLMGVGLINASKAHLQEASNFIGNGLLNGTLNPVVGQQYSMEEVVDAVKNLGNGAGIHGKPIINILGN